MKKQHYTVAGHTFCLEMAEDERLWNYLDTAYAPFYTRADSPESLFTLKADEFLPAACPVGKPLVEQRGADGNLFRYYKSDSYYWFEDFSPEGEWNGALCVADDFRTATVRLCAHPVRRGLMTDYGIMLMYILNTAPLETFVMHASAVVSKGKGYLLMGKSGTGKSTHCDLWERHIPGSERLNDDHPVIRFTNDIPEVYGSPWSGKTACYRNLSVPIGGFVRLRQSVRNHIYRLTPLEAYASLAAGCAAMTWKPEHADAKDRIIQRLVGSVPCWLLECLPDEAAARLCAATVRKEIQV